MKTQMWIATAASIACATFTASPLALAQASDRGPAKTAPDAPRDAQGDSSRTPTGVKRPSPVLRKPIINLEDQAKARRPGQIMPGDPAPNAGPSGAMIEIPASERVDPAPTPVPIKREPRSREDRPRVSSPAAEMPAESAAPASPSASAEDSVPASSAPAPSARTVERTPPKAAASVPATPAAPKPATSAAAEAPQAEPLPELSQPAPEQHEAARPVAAVATDIAAPANELAQAKPVDRERAPAIDRPESQSSPALAPTAEPAPRAVPQPEPRVTAPSEALSQSPQADLPPVTVLGPSSVAVLRTSGDGSVEWRQGDASWSPAATAATASGRVEIRAGLDGDAVFVINDRVELRVGRLARVAIETATEGDGSKTIHLTLGRGAVEVRPVPGAQGSGWSQWIARIRTPDRAVALIGPSSIEYDAFAGSRIKLLPPSEHAR